jgi:ATP-binding protein involved in chromosome partitioning
MTTLNKEAVEAALKELRDPEIGRDVIGLGQVKDVQTDESAGRVAFTLELASHSAPLKQDMLQEAEDLLRRKIPAIKEVQINLAENARPPRPLGPLGLPVKSIIAVGSGKGGVGKSTVAAALAYAMQRYGCRVGLLDADVYGPSIPHLLGLNERPEINQQQKIVPLEKDGIRMMSMGLLVPRGQAVVWRGPMLHQYLTQMLRDTAWGDLDYLFIDMPPGTGDVPLSLSQLVPATGAVVVCTPQEVALLDAEKAIGMFHTVKIPVLGMVENMSGFAVPGSDQRYDIFGHGGARAKAEEIGVPFLGDVPIVMGIREKGDAGQMSAVFDDPASAVPFERIAYQLAKVQADEVRRNPPKPQLPVL